MNNYRIRWKRKIIWHTFKNVVGHQFAENQNKLAVYFDDGSLCEIKKWTDCEIALGVDWFLAVKRHEEEKAGINIKTNEK